MPTLLFMGYRGKVKKTKSLPGIDTVKLNNVCPLKPK